MTLETVVSPTLVLGKVMRCDSRLRPPPTFLALAGPGLGAMSIVNQPILNQLLVSQNDLGFTCTTPHLEPVATA